MLFTGHNLTSPTAECWAGYYCVSGNIQPNPTMLNDSQCPTTSVHPIIGHVCPAGHYCQQGTAYPVGCPAGKYQDLTTENDCKSCPVGHYCLANTTDYTPNVCPAGYYCPLETPQAYEFPCPPGYFNNLTAQHNASACQLCPPGMYCQGDGNSEPTGKCDPGWYCIEGSNSSRVGSH